MTLSGILKQTITGVEVHISEEGHFNFRVVKLVRQGNQIDLAEESAQFENVEELVENIGKQNPISLTISGKGILNRSTPANLESGPELVRAVLPKASPIDFYVHAFKSNGNTFFSVARKSMVDSILVELFKKDLQVVSLSLGIGSLQVLSLVTGNTIVGYETSIDFEKGEVEAGSSNDQLPGSTIKIGSDEIHRKYSLALASGLRFLLSPEEVTSPENKTTDHHLEEYGFQKKTKLLAISTIVFLFLLLVTNLLVFQHYQKLNHNLDQELGLKTQTVSQLKELESQVHLQETMIGELGIENRVSRTYINNEIASILPSEIQLTSLFVHPPAKKIKMDKEIDFQHDQIFVEGITQSSTKLNNWLNDIRKYEFVREVNLVNYNRLEDPKGQFEIHILPQ